jgi:hypothetical protein
MNFNLMATSFNEANFYLQTLKKVEVHKFFCSPKGILLLATFIYKLSISIPQSKQNSKFQVFTLKFPHKNKPRIFPYISRSNDSQFFPILWFGVIPQTG